MKKKWIATALIFYSLPSFAQSLIVLPQSGASFVQKTQSGKTFSANICLGKSNGNEILPLANLNLKVVRISALRADQRWLGPIDGRLDASGCMVLKDETVSDTANYEFWIDSQIFPIQIKSHENVWTVLGGQVQPLTFERAQSTCAKDQFKLVRERVRESDGIAEVLPQDICYAQGIVTNIIVQRTRNIQFCYEKFGFSESSLPLLLAVYFDRLELADNPAYASGPVTSKWLGFFDRHPENKTFQACLKKQLQQIRMPIDAIRENAPWVLFGEILVR